MPPTPSPLRRGRGWGWGRFVTPSESPVLLHVVHPSLYHSGFPEIRGNSPRCSGTGQWRIWTGLLSRGLDLGMEGLMEPRGVFYGGSAYGTAPAGATRGSDTLREVNASEGIGVFAGRSVRLECVERTLLRSSLRASMIAVLLLLMAGVLTGCALEPTPVIKLPTPTPENITATPLLPTSAPSATVLPLTSTPTPEPGSRTLVLTPKAGDVGWWASNDSRGGHLGDSFLYAGYFDDDVFASAVRLDLRQVPRGAPIRDAVLHLTGLQDDRLSPSADDGGWTVQFLPPEEFKDFARGDFQSLYNAPAAVTLFPILSVADLAANRENSLSLDASAREWLGRQVADGVGSIVLRITGPVGGTPSMFAWDSGSGPMTAGAGPQLVMNLGAAPATPPPLPSRPFIVATLTPTPANVLTVAADMLSATALAQEGTMTPLPYELVTPTPIEWPVVITPTPVSENGATATIQAAYATAVAMTTGTFTPIPTNAVTPVVVMPTPMPENVLTAAVRMLAATAEATRFGTSTPLPFNAVVATVTPRLVVATSTPRPLNAATARAIVAYATAAAITTGTPTRSPRIVTPTPPPPTPLLVYLDSLPPPQVTPTATPGTVIPRALVGKILFWSDREGTPRLFALDPTNNRIAYLTQEWPYFLARNNEAQSPDGRYTVLVQDRWATAESESPIPGVFIQDKLYKQTNLLAPVNGWSYDPVFSPRDNRIAFVSAQGGNDEIYSINPDGSDMRRLTSNTWEWDKHPSWSPDGSQIVFWSNRDTGRRQLWVMNADGSNPHLLLKSTFNDWDPVWGK